MNKLFAVIVLFSSLLNGVCAQTVKEDKEIALNRVEVHHPLLDRKKQYFMINDSLEYLKLMKGKPMVDLVHNTLIGIVMHTWRCKEPKEPDELLTSLKYYLSDSSYLFHVGISSDDCRKPKPFTIERWYLVPKIENTDKLKFETAPLIWINKEKE
jgi:hypothetical protein